MNTVSRHLQIGYEFSMAIGTSLDLKIMLRKSISTILRKLNCQAGSVYFIEERGGEQLCFEKVFSIPRDTGKIVAFNHVLSDIPGKFDRPWLLRFQSELPCHHTIDTSKQIYCFALPDIGIFILLKHGNPLEELFVKSLDPLFKKLATACQACIQNQELIQHKENLETLVEDKTRALHARNMELQEQVREREQAEAEGRENRERYEAVIKQASEGIVLIEPDSKRVLESNASFQNMLGYSEQEAHQLTVYDFVTHSRQNIDNILADVSEQQERSLGERVYQHKSGALIEVETSAKLINFSDGKAILGIIRNVSEKKRAEAEKEALKEKLRQAQKFEALGTLAGGVAHDLNNILSGIVGYPELLLRKLPEDSELRGPLETIQDSGKRAATVVADLLTIARSAASPRQVCDLNDLIREYFSSPEHGNITKRFPDVSYVQNLGSESSLIMCSPVHIKKSLMNLVVNAAEAVEKEGEVTVTTANSAAPPDSSEDMDPASEYVVMDVRDSGPGIAQTDLDHIFDPFYTRKDMGMSGTGLGLTVVWNTVNDHGGSIKISTGSQGTSIRLFFPVSTVNASPQVPAASLLHATDRHEHILVVDDEPMICDLATEILTHLGYRVESVSSGEEALTYLAASPVDLVIIDMLMGSGINGRETYERIISRSPDIKAIIASGYSESDEVKQALKLGANGYIQKPYGFDQLGKAVKTVLDSD